MNYIAMGSICCCLQVCNQLSTTLIRLLGRTPFLKSLYLLLVLGSTLLALLLVSLLSSSWAWLVPDIAPGITCNATSSVGCVSASAVYRISLCLVVFGGVMAVVLRGCGRAGLVLNDGLFFSKFVLLVLGFGLTLQVDNGVFMAYGQVAKLISYPFMLCQAAILIDLAYLWGISWAKKYSHGRAQYGLLLILTSAAIFTLAGYLLVSSFLTHVPQLLWADIVCVVQVLALVGIQLLNYNKQNSLLTTSVVCLLVSYYTWSAGYSYPMQQSATSPDNISVMYLSLGINLLLLLLSTCGSIYGSTLQSQPTHIDLDNPPENQQLTQQRDMWVLWMLYLMGMSAYMAMLVTDWGSADIVRGEFNLTSGAWASKLAMGWVLVLGYGWTMVAPRVCPGRRWEFE